MVTARMIPWLGGIAIGGVIAGVLVLSTLTLFGTNAICAQGVLCELAGYRNVGAARGVHLVGTSDPYTELAVVWETPGAQHPPTVLYRRAGGGQWSSAQGTSTRAPANGILASDTTIHHVRMTGLEPGRAYQYRVSWDARSRHQSYSPVFSARTLARNEPIKLGFIADTCLQDRPDGRSGPIHDIMKQLQREHPDLILGGGDYACALDDGRFATAEPAVQRFFDEWQPLLSSVPFIGQYGNHECCHGESTQLWSPRLQVRWAPYRTEDGRSFAFDLGQARIVGLYGTGAQSTIDPAHLRWLHETLSDAVQIGQRNLIVFQHAPLFGTGQAHPPHAEMQRQLVPLLEQHQVDLFLSAHDMSYERTLPLTGAAEGHPLSSALGPIQGGPWPGVVYVKLSPTGRTTSLEHHLGDVQPPYMAVSDEGRFYYGILVLSADGSLEFTAYAFDGQGRRSVIDQFTLGT